MIDGSKTRKSLAGVEVQSLYVIERRSNYFKKFTRYLINLVVDYYSCPSKNQPLEQLVTYSIKGSMQTVVYWRVKTTEKSNPSALKKAASDYEVYTFHRDFNF